MNNQSQNKKAKDLLIESLTGLTQKAEVGEFLKSLMSSTEIEELSRRLLAAKLLINGETYNEIREKMGMSPITINKIRFKAKGSPVLKKLYQKD